MDSKNLLSKYRRMLCCVLSAGSIFSQTIKPLYHGQNAAMVFAIGSATLNGQMDLNNFPAGNVAKWPDVAQTGAKSVRFGGIALDLNAIPANVSADYVHIITDARANGIEPILQVPFSYTGAGVPASSVITNAANDAAAIVNFINNTAFPNNKVLHWIIANEPNGPPHNFQLLPNPDDEAKLICAYTQAFSKAMRAADPASTLIIIGPELSYYDNYAVQTGTNNANHLVNQLCDVSNSLTNITGYNPSTGLPYIDIFSIHAYPFVDQFAVTPTSNSVIANLRASGQFDQNLTSLSNILSSASVTTALNRGVGNAQIKMAVTEANICFRNNTGALTPITAKLNGTDANSFLGGQFWAEMAAIGMEHNLEYLNFYSVVEGDNGTDSDRTNIGYLDHNTGNERKPTYWHSWMIANNFTGTFVPVSTLSLQGVSTPTNIKAFAARSNGQVAVMIMNQQTGPGSLPFKVHLDGPPVSSSTLDIGFNIPDMNGAYYASNTATNEIQNQSTILLVFKCPGIPSMRYDYTLADAIVGSSVTPTTYSPVLTTFTPGLISAPISFSPQNVPISSYSCSTITLSPPNYTFAWSTVTCNPITSSPTGTTISLCACAGTNQAIYTFTATGPNGCTNTQNITVTGDQVPEPTGVFYAYMYSVTPASCGLNNGIAIAGSGNHPAGVSYKFDNGPYTPSFSVTGLSPGIHTVTVMNSATPTPVAQTITINFFVPIAPGPPPPNANFTTNNLCSNSAVCFTSTMLSGTHSWTITSPLQTSTQGSPCFNLSAGTYTVNHSVHTQSCSATYSNIITVISPPELTATVSVNNICAGEQAVTLGATGGAVTFTWNPGTLVGNPVIVTPTITTTYTVNGTNNSGCVGSAYVTVNVGECCLRSAKHDPVIDLGNVTIVAPGQSAVTWNSLVPGSIYNGAIALPSVNYIISGRYNVTAGLTINTPVTFSLSEIAFGDWVAANQNASTVIDKSYWHGCSKMWQGITSTNSLNMANSVIEDADFGIKVNAGAAIYPGLSIDNAFFNRNFGGIWLSGNTISNFRITGSIFTSRNINSGYPYSSGLRWNSLPAYNSSGLVSYPIGLLKNSNYFIGNWRGQIGIILTGAQTLAGTGNVQIGDVDAHHNSQLTNVFDNIRTGVASAYSKGSMYNNLFQNIYNIPSNDFGNLSSCSYNYSTSTTIGSNINGNVSALYTNSFVSSGIGVYATQNGTLSVYNNKFSDISFVGTQVLQWYATASNTSPVNINKNNFNNCLYDLFAFDNSNINLIFNNNISTFTGTSMRKSTGGIHAYVLELNKPLTAKYDISYNNSTGKIYGVYCANVYNASINDNTLTIGPIPVNAPQGAIWLQNTDNSEIKENVLNVNPSNSNNLNTSGIFNSIGVNNLFCHNDIKGAGASMKFMGTSPSRIYWNSLNNNPSDPCYFGLFLDQNGYVGPINYPLNWNVTGSALNVFGDFTWADTYADNNSIGSRIDYPGPPFTNNPDYPNVNFAVSPATAFMPVQNNIVAPNQCGNPAMIFQNLSKGVPPFINNLLSFGPNNANSNAIADKGIFELFRKNSINTASVTGSAAFMSANSTAAIGNFHTMDSLVVQRALTGNTLNIVQASAMNSALIPATNIEQNQKTFNSIFHTYLQGDTLVTPAQINTLKSIAQLCPFTDGTNVYQARALLKHYDTTEYFNVCEYNLPVLGQNRISNHGGSVTSQVNLTPEALMTEVFPNPALSEITITTEVQGARILIYDVIGQLVIETALTSETKLNVSELKNGTYLYKIMKDKILIKSERLIINK